MKPWKKALFVAFGFLVLVGVVALTWVSVPAGETVHLSFPVPMGVAPLHNEPWCLIAQFSPLQDIPDGTRVSVTVVYVE